MTHFMDEQFLLGSATAQTLYHNYAADMAIVDYHCHVSPREIFEDKHFDNITQVWLGGDHYKWRLMRSNGVSEHYITGDAEPYEKFERFAELLPKAIGNPMYHWCHLELKRYFGYDGILCRDTAREVWELANEKLKSPDMSARGIIKSSGVAFIGTTDDPVDTLEYHKLLREDKSFDTVVAPSFRPDKALNIEKAGFREYISRLSEVSGTEIRDIDSLKAALSQRIAYFAENGCRASDHGLDFAVFKNADKKELNGIISRALAGESISAADAEAEKSAGEVKNVNPTPVLKEDNKTSYEKKKITPPTGPKYDKTGKNYKK